MSPLRDFQTPAFITDVTADIEKDWCVTVRKLALAHVVSKNTIHNTLHKDLNLQKKSARWVPKLLTDEMKMVRVQTSEAFLAIICRRSKAMLDSVVTMDKTAV
jgi:histone-lysine N-methyltransferase SETMAR